MAKDRARRADALQRERERAEAQRIQAEQARIAADQAEAEWEAELASRPQMSAAQILMHGLNTFEDEMAKERARREESARFLRDAERRAAAIAAQREREQANERARLAEARRRDQIVATQPTQHDSAEQRAREALERNLRAQAAAERARLQQARNAQSGSTFGIGSTSSPATSGAGTSTAPGAAPRAPAPAAKPLRFVLYVPVLAKAGDTVNPMCYSNVITRPGPPGWGSSGFLPDGSAEQASQAVEAMKSTFVERCRAASQGREVRPVSHVQHTTNQNSDEDVANTRARHREDITVSL